jgi:hypothetical protein
MCNSETGDRIKKLKIAKFDQYANAIFSVNPDLMVFLAKENQILATIANWEGIETLPYKGVIKV